MTTAPDQQPSQAPQAGMPPIIINNNVAASSSASATAVAERLRCPAEASVVSGPLLAVHVHDGDRERRVRDEREPVEQGSGPVALWKHREALPALGAGGASRLFAGRVRISVSPGGVDVRSA